MFNAREVIKEVIEEMEYEENLNNAMEFLGEHLKGIIQVAPIVKERLTKREKCKDCDVKEGCIERNLERIGLREQAAAALLEALVAYVAIENEGGKPENDDSNN